MSERTVLHELVEEVAVLEEFASGWRQELNIVKWNGGEPKWDIRQWSPEHEKMSRGTTLFEYEMKKLVEAYLEHGGIKPTKKPSELISK